MSKYREQLEEYLKTLDIKTDKALDIGGSANPIDKRVKSWDVKDYKILDNNNEKGLHDKWREPDYISNIGDFAGIPGETDERKLQWDTIFCLEVLEYLKDPRHAMMDIALLLKFGGIVYVTTCFGYPVHNPTQSDSSRLTKEGAEKIFIDEGLEILECIPRRYSPEAFDHIQQAWAIDGLRNAKHYPDHDVIGHIFKLKKK